MFSIFLFVFRLYICKIIEEGEIQILNEKDIKQQAIDELLKVYEEVPVDIDTFLEDPQYLGKTTNYGKAIYPAWREALREIFKDPYRYTIVILTGCIGSNFTASRVQ